jgi:PKD repeat protein
MVQDTVNFHSGNASMSLGCGNTGCYTSSDVASISASTDPAFCAAIGPGTHPASFWYQANPEGTSVSLYAVFFQAADCTGGASGDFLGDSAIVDNAWHQVTGELHAPHGTESALFTIGASYPCEDFCSFGAGFDDLDVEDAVVADTTPPETTITSGPSGTTSSTSGTFEFTASEPSTFECSLDTATFTACSSPTSYSGLGDGSHTFRVRAIDAAGNTDPTPAERTWTVHQNTAPTAGFSFSCSARSCSFDGSASTDSDGTIQNYGWDFGDGTRGSGQTVQHDYAQSGTYTVSLTVTDDGGATDTVAKTVTIENTAPTASFTPSCSGLSCSFDGGTSTDSDGTISDYSWDFGDGTRGSGKTVQHDYNNGGTFQVTLTVTDSGGATASDSGWLTVIGLSARGYKVKGLEKVDLSWTGPSGVNFDVYRDSDPNPIAKDVSGTAYTDNLGKRGPGTYTYKVCQTGTLTCSNEAKVTF